MKKVLLVGESWHVHTTESKGFDVFSYDYYEEASGPRSPARATPSCRDFPASGRCCWAITS